MTTAQIEAAAAIITTALAVAAFLRTMFRSGKAQAEKQEADRRANYDAGFKAGVESQAAEKALLRSQRDDARRERDTSERRGDAFENRYNDLRDKGH